MKPDTRRAVEAAVHEISRAFGDLLMTFEQRGEDISNTESQKVFNFLTRSLQIVGEKANHAREIASVTRGAFSFDMEIAEPPAAKIVQPVSPPVMKIESGPAPSSDRVAAFEERKRLGGRLSAHSPEIHPELETAPVFPSSGSEYVDPEISFMDE
jgi:hypothetical protein